MCFEPLITAEHVNTTFAADPRRRCANASEENPANTTEWTAPMRAQASIAIGSSIIIGKYSTTASPLATPTDFSQFASRLTSAWSSLYVFVPSSPTSLPSQINATCSPQPLSIFRSMQFHAMLVFPPANHETSTFPTSVLKLKALTLSDQSALQTKSLASLDQNFSGSVTDSR